MLPHFYSFVSPYVSGCPNAPHASQPLPGIGVVAGTRLRRVPVRQARLRAPDVRNYSILAALPHFYNVELVYIYSLTHSSYTHTHTRTRAHTHAKKIFSHGSAVVEFRNFLEFLLKKRTHTRTRARIHTHAHARTHTHTHARTHTHTHTRLEGKKIQVTVHLLNRTGKTNHFSLPLFD